MYLEKGLGFFVDKIARCPLHSIKMTDIPFLCFFLLFFNLRCVYFKRFRCFFYIFVDMVLYTYLDFLLFVVLIKVGNQTHCT